ncbi:5776_t:CDS:2, partial [Entrophospora sp. SA101]
MIQGPLHNHDTRLELPKGQLDNNDTKSTNELLSNDSLESFLPQQTNNNNQELPVSEPNNEPKSKSPTVNNNGNKSNCDCGKRGMDAIEDTGNEPLESVFELPKDWALKSNQKYGQKGGDNCMPVQITNLLEGFFLAGEADRTRRYTAETMLEVLNVMAEEEGQFDKSKVPKLQTIRGWITSYAAVFKRKNAKRTLEE